MAERKVVDWERIEAQYRAGVQSLREIASEHGITHGAVNKRANRDGWPRDLAAKIHAKAEALVSKALVSAEVSNARRVSEREVIEAGALRIAQVRGEHRSDVTRMRSLALRLLAECEAEAADPGLFAELGEIMRRPDENGRDPLGEVYRKVISLPQRIKGVKELAETMKTLIGLEREAYGIDAKSQDGAADDPKMGEAEVANRLAFIMAQAKARAPQ